MRRHNNRHVRSMTMPLMNTGDATGLAKSVIMQLAILTGTSVTSRILALTGLYMVI